MSTSGQDLINSLRYKTSKLDRAISSLPELGSIRAQTERDYRVALRQEIVRELEKGTKVTIMSDLCRGESNIAALRFARDVAKSNYDATFEAINVWKLEIRLLENQVAREWGRTEPLD